MHLGVGSLLEPLIFGRQFQMNPVKYKVQRIKYTVTSTHRQFQMNPVARRGWRAERPPGGLWWVEVTVRGERAARGPASKGALCMLQLPMGGG